MNSQVFHLWQNQCTHRLPMSIFPSTAQDTSIIGQAAKEHTPKSALQIHNTFLGHLVQTPSRPQKVLATYLPETSDRMHACFEYGEAPPCQEVPETHHAQLPCLGRGQQSVVAIECQGCHLHGSRPLQKGTLVHFFFFETAFLSGEYNFLFHIIELPNPSLLNQLSPFSSHT